MEKHYQGHAPKNLLFNRKVSIEKHNRYRTMPPKVLRDTGYLQMKDKAITSTQMYKIEENGHEI